MIYLAYILRKRQTSYMAACGVFGSEVFRRLYWLFLFGISGFVVRNPFSVVCLSDRRQNLNNRTLWHLCAKQHRMCIGYA